MLNSPPTNSDPVTLFLAAWPSARQQLAAQIAARVAVDAQFPRRYAEAQIALLDAAMHQLGTLLRYLQTP